MKKRLAFLILCFISATLAVFSFEAKSKKGLFYVKTKHFDIIYAPASRENAALLAKKADALYEEIASLYKLKHDLRLPVFLISGDDTLNGYFTIYPFNHIVIYDAPITEDMAVFSDTLVSIFRHELTHAISYNVREGFSRFIQVTFGDAINFGSFIITTAWAEGAAVSSESMHGEGRVNDEYSMHMIKQAKIEGRFPRYSEVNGTKDIYPYTRESYAFGGAFNAWLQKKYGMEKYAEFWHMAVNIKTLSYFWAFKKVYKKPLKQVWQEWRDEFPVSPDLRQELSWSRPAKQELSSHSSLSSAGDEFCYYDENESAVYVFALKGEKYKKIKKIKASAVSRVHLSEDGKILAVSFTKRGVKRSENRVKFYNLKSGKSFFFNESGVKEAATFYFEGELYAVLVKAKGSASFLKTYKMEAGSFKECASFEAEENAAFFHPVALSGARVAFIYKKGLNFSIRFFELKTKEVREIKMPFDNVVIRSLSANGETLCFSWTKELTMPRAGFIDFASGKIKTQRYDISGGVFSPVIANKEKGFYIASYFDGTKLMRMDTQKMETDETDIVFNSIEKYEKKSETKSEEKHFSEEKPFCAFSFLFKKRGTLIPFSSLMTYGIDSESLSLESKRIPLGFSYTTSTPWTSPVLSFQGGYSVAHASGGVGVSITGASKTSLFSYGLNQTVLFDKKGYKQSAFFLALNLTLPLFAPSPVRLKIGEKASFFHGRQSDFSKTLSFDLSKEKLSYYLKRIPALYEGDDKERLFVQNSLAFGVSTLHGAGREIYEIAGFTSNIIWETSLFKNMKAAKAVISNNVGLLSRAYFPRLLPFNNPRGITVNFPFSLSLDVFPSRKILLNAGIKAVLFSKEIQWSPNFFPVLYVNRFTIEGAYIGGFLNKKYKAPYFERVMEMSNLATGGAAYEDLIQASVKLEMTPNLGSFARSDFIFDFDVTVKYSPTLGKWSLSIFAINVF